MSSRRLFRYAAPLVFVCLLLTAAPSFAAPGPDAPQTVLQRLHEVWNTLLTEVMAPVNRLFAANGMVIDPDGTPSSQTVTVSGTADPTTTASGGSLSAPSI